MKTNVFVNYTVCKCSNKDITMSLSVEQYEDLIGMLAFFGEVFDIRADVNTVTDEHNPENVDVYITQKVVVY